VASVAPALAERFTVVCPVLRGYGNSDKPPGDFWRGPASVTAAEPGCRRFEVLELAEAAEIVLLIDWANEQALREHFATPHYRRYRDAVGELLARPSDVTVHHVADTVHALDPNPPDPAMFG
jgi:quinol monooxygenase YgiN